MAVKNYVVRAEYTTRRPYLSTCLFTNEFTIISGNVVFFIFYPLFTDIQAGRRRRGSGVPINYVLSDVAVRRKGEKPLTRYTLDTVPVIVSRRPSNRRRLLPFCFPGADRKFRITDRPPGPADVTGYRRTANCAESKMIIIIYERSGRPVERDGCRVIVVVQWERAGGSSGEGGCRCK